VISQILEAKTATRMTIDPYSQRQNNIPLGLNVLLAMCRCIDHIDIAGRSSVRVYNQNKSRRKWWFSTYIRDNISQTVSITATVTINHR